MDTFDEVSDISSEQEEEEEEEDVFDYNTQSLAQYRNITKGKEERVKEMNSMWYLTIESLGTALKIFAPAAILSWFYKHDTFVFRILQQCDKAIRSVLFQKHGNQDDVIAWLQDIFPYDERARSLETIWNDGSIICDLVESVVPGSNEHNKFEKNDFYCGQRLAEKYLGVNPIFSNDDLSNTILSKQQESRLTFYLNSIKDSLNRLSPPISRTGSPILNAQAYTFDYIARGMGLISASKNKRSSFYIYPTAQQCIDPGDISIQIKGPGGCYGSTLIPAVYGKSHIIRNVLMNFKNYHNSLPVHLPIPCGSSNVKKSDVQNEDRNYFTSKIVNDIEVYAINKNDKIKIMYVPNAVGPHELTLISKGCHIIGSPFRVYVESETTRNDSQDLEDENIPVDKPDKSDRKIVFKIVDFVTEKMLLTDDGRLEKISTEDVATLLHTVESMENIALKYLQCDIDDATVPRIDIIDTSEAMSKRNFNNAVKKVLLMLRICRELKEMPQTPKKLLDNNSIPDIINSSMTDKFNNDAKAKRYNYKSKISSFNQTSEDSDPNVHQESNIFKSVDPRLTMIATEHTPLMDIIISSFEDDDDYMENVAGKVSSVLPERPKTPIFKLLADIDDSCENDVEDNIMLDVDDVINGRCTPTIDFHIGEPVTPANSSNNVNSDDMDSIILSSNLEEALLKYDIKVQRKLVEYESEDSNSSMFNTPLRQTPFEQMTDTEIIKMYEEPYDERSCTVDSAYLSIEEINKSSKDKLFSIEETDGESFQFDEVAYAKMGPAERELWISMTEHENFKEHNFISQCKITEQFKNESYPKIIQNNQCTITPIDENEIYTKKPHTIKNDISTSDFTADAKLSEKNLSRERIISSVQLNNAEFEDVNCLSSANNVNKLMTNGDSPKKTISKMVSEKKEYWDEIIKSIEIEEVQLNKNAKNKTTNLNKSTSLNNKRQDYVNSNEDMKNHSESDISTLDRYKVANWKKYWNEKLEKTPSSESNTQYIHKKLASTRQYLASPDDDNASDSYENIQTPSMEYKDVELQQYTDREQTDLTKDLSNRIDEYLDTLSNPSPIKQHDDSRFSTPDNREYNSLDSLLKLEKNDNRILVKWNNSHSEKRMNVIMQDLSNRPTPLPQVLDPDPLIDSKLDSIEYIKMELESLPTICNVKEKIENYNENRVEKARQSFIKNRSKTIDIPRVSSFRRLQKYFSINTMDKLNQTEQNGALSKLSRDMNAKIENLSQIERDKSDSVPSLAEKKARIEAHLILIQTKRKNQPENLNKTTENHIHSEKVLNNVANQPENVNCDIKSELEEIAKPIGALVAVFEKQNTIKDRDNTIKDRDNTIKRTKIKSNKSNQLVVQDAVSTIDANVDEAANEDINSDKYKERFKQAKMFFQSLNGLQKNHDKNNTKSPNECEKLLRRVNERKNQVSETKHKKIARKAYSAPTSDSETEYQKYIWKRHGKDKLLKISEKYFVEDLFKDIASNKIGFGAFKGIPHKNAVLATFKSMENINQFPSYEYTKTQLENFTTGSSIGDLIFPQDDKEKNQPVKDHRKQRRIRRNSEPNIAR